MVTLCTVLTCKQNCLQFATVRLKAVDNVLKFREERTRSFGDMLAETDTLVTILRQPVKTGNDLDVLVYEYPVA